ncbi:MAG: hypothetical protein B6I23_03255 [Rickettsiaceae bacterium 4572_127]|nr:MAG: hypothetical protein B6I23_03255 [Rickettsiaceae bacterium 4572_127]
MFYWWVHKFYPAPKQLKLLLTRPQGAGDKQESKKARKQESKKARKQESKKERKKESKVGEIPTFAGQPY